MTAEAPPDSQQRKPEGTDSWTEHRQPDGSKWPMPPVDGYTVDDYFTLDLPPHTELIDGSLVFVRPQRAFHSLVMFLLEKGLRLSLPEHLRVRREMAVVLGPRNAPEPDLVVIKAEGETGRRQTRYEAADVLLAVEVVSPDSEERDRDTKPHKYAAARIPHFWRVDGRRPRPPHRPHLRLRPGDKGVRVHRGAPRPGQAPPSYDIDIDLTEFDHL